MPEWVIPLIEKAGWPALIVVVTAMSVSMAVSRGLWPFFLKEMWPEILKQREHDRAVSAAQSTQLKALYDIVIKVTSDYTISTVKQQAALEDMQATFRESIKVIESALEIRFDRLIEKLDKQTDAINALVMQWQSMAAPFVEERRSGHDPDYGGAERRRK